MPIRTAATDKKYIRVIGMFEHRGVVNRHGQFGIVTSRTRVDDGTFTGTLIGKSLVFAKIKGESRVFEEKEVEYITKKEYFIGALGS